MKAIIIHNYGLSNMLALEETSIPSISANEILIKVHASGVNHIDSLKATGIIKHIYPLQFPWIPGADFAGIIEEIGKDVTEFKIGDEVYGSKAEGGAYAEFIVATPDIISKKPRSLTFVEAASVPMVADTALQGLFKHGQLKSGQTILIHGAAGAVGSYAVQLAHWVGANVIATASGSDKDYLFSLGADEVIDYKATNFELVGVKVDMVFDLVGGEVQQRSFAVIKESGYLIATNQLPSIEDAEKFKINALFMHAKPSSKSLNEISELIDTGKLKVDIAKVYALKDASHAWKNIANNFGGRVSSQSLTLDKKHGKHVLQVI